MFALFESVSACLCQLLRTGDDVILVKKKNPQLDTGVTGLGGSDAEDSDDSVDDDDF